MSRLIQHHEQLDVYSGAFDAAMQIFELSKRFPPEERFSLTDQIRRSSRGVCANIAEAWRQRRYPLAFCMKLSLADSEAAETQVWLRFARQCNYMSAECMESLWNVYENAQRTIVGMIIHSEKWCFPSKTRAKTSH